MKKLKLLLTLVILIGIISVVTLKKGSHISTNVQYKSLMNPKVNSIEKMRISYIETAYAETPEAFAYAGGSLFKSKKLSHMAVYVSHPKGDFLFDTGLGDNIDEQFETMQGWLKPFFKYTKINSAKSVLLKNNIDIKKIYLSHMHWDHVSGIDDFPQANIFTTETEYKFATSEKASPPAFIHSQYQNKKTKWNFIKFDSGPYEIFDHSFDLYGDGSIVFVKLIGHSPGSIGMFVNFSLSKRFFFTGDITWSIEGFKRPAEKFYISSLLVDSDRVAIKDQIAEIGLLMQNNPNIKIIPAHDFDAYKNILSLAGETIE